MTQHSLRRQPDDPGTRGLDYVDPLIFDGRKARKCPSTVATIRRNRNTTPAIVIAQALGWGINRLLKVAKEYDIELRYQAGEIAKPEQARGR